MARRTYGRVTNTQLAERQDALETEMKGVKADVKKLSEEMAPLHSGLMQIQAGVTLVKWLVSGLGVVATVLEIFRALHH